MRRTFVTLLLCAVTLTCAAQTEKITERSAKKAPAWLGISDSDQFSVSATAPTLDAAQQKCLADIRQYIVNTIASNISSTEEFGQQQTTRDGLVTIFSHYSSQVDTKAGMMPFLSDISLSRSLDNYWERRFKKDDKSYYYIFHVRYPFTEAERSAAIAEFRRMDDGYQRKLDAIRSKFDTFTDMGYIEQAVIELNPLIDYFFDANRKSAARALQQQYMQANGQVTVVRDNASLGRYSYHLLLAGRKVTTDKQPTLRSDYATDMRVEPAGGGYALCYTPMGIDTEENRIEMSYTFGGRMLRHSVVFDPLDETVRIRPFGSILIERGKEDVPSLVSMSLRSETPNRFEINFVEAHIPQLGTIRGELAEVSFEGKGVHTLRFEALVLPGEVKAALAKGTLRITNPKTGVTTDLPFALTYKTIINR